MNEKVKEYKKYLKKCEMLGINMFKIKVIKDNVWIIKYIPNNEKERLVKIPDFVCGGDEFAFNGVHQRLTIVGSKLRYIGFSGYGGNKIDLGKLDTSNMRIMKSMFCGCSNLKEIDLSNFNTSKVESMTSMFHWCKRLEKLDLSSFDTSNVTIMEQMFNWCENLKELDISNFDTSRVFIKNDMFNGCDNLKLIIANERTKEWLERNREVTKLNEGCIIKIRSK